MTYSFKTHLKDVVVEKNLHLEHAEEEILNRGKQGATLVDTALKNIIEQLAGHTNKKYNITSKWDGSPAIIVGKNPETGNFFVGTKSVFNKVRPKIAETDKDIDEMYGDKPPLAKLLKQALKYLPALQIDGIYQGDVMFGGDVAVLRQKIDGQTYWTFNPNTITYAVPVDSKLGDKIHQAQFGIIFHTRYVGTTIKDSIASFDVNVSKFNQSKDVWFDDASYKDITGNASFTKTQTTKIKNHLTKAEAIVAVINKTQLNKLVSNKKLVALIKMYINANIRKGQHYGNINKFVESLEQFIHLRIDGEKVKDDTKAKKKQQHSDDLKELHTTLKQVVEWQSHINEIKLMLVDKLNRINQIGTFIQSGSTFKSTTPEGYVAVDHLNNHAIKLVDRLEFSRNNFANRG